MKNILVTGASGQIGSELVPALREKYGNDRVIAAGHSRALPEEMAGTGPSTAINVAEYEQVAQALREYNIERIFHLSSVLSAKGEQHPDLAFQVNIIGMQNVLRAAREQNVQQVIVPSSIAAFGPETPREDTPNDTIQKPRTMYGISKVLGELLGTYYYERFGLDVRGVRFPGIISWKTEPTAGTTDYAVAIFYEAVRKGTYACYLKEDTRLPMMYMPDAIKALIDLSEAEGRNLRHRTDFNVAAMSFTPAELAAAIKKRMPAFTVTYEIDPVRQAIAESWPTSLDDSAARREWDWSPTWNMDKMVDDMLENLRKKLKPQN